MEREFVSQSLLDLSKNDCITEVSYVPVVINPLSVAKNSEGKKRLILDLRYLNLLLFKQIFRCEALSTAREIFQQGDFLFKFAHKSGYHHIEIAEVHHTYLGFEWEFEGTRRVYHVY